MNTHLQNARIRKDDEFYTPYEEVERVIDEFRPYFRNKVVYCNCDDERSAFYKYFKNNFDNLRLKHLYVSGIHIDYVISYDGVKETKIPIYDGDYKSSELFKFVRESDIIVTNPPFSLFRQYFDFVYLSGKKFLIMGDKLGSTASNVYPFITSENVFPVLHKTIKFEHANKAESIVWITNLPVNFPPFIDTGKKYSKEKYQFFDNYPDILNVNELKDIPMDYRGIMGVPMTFLRIWNPRQFKLIDNKALKNAYVNGVNKFERILIQRKY